MAYDSRKSAFSPGASLSSTSHNWGRSVPSVLRRRPKRVLEAVRNERKSLFWQEENQVSSDELPIEKSVSITVDDSRIDCHDQDDNTNGLHMQQLEEIGIERTYLKQFEDNQDANESMAEANEENSDQSYNHKSGYSDQYESPTTSFNNDGIQFSDQPPESNPTNDLLSQEEQASTSKLACETTSAAVLQTMEFSFLDNKNICCGMCGEIVPYDQLTTDHLPNSHPTVWADNSAMMHEMPFEQWLKDKLYSEKRAIESGFKMSVYQSAARLPKGATIRSTFERPSRKVSTIRVNPREMTLHQLEQALRKKMYEKLGRHVPVSLIDKIHARCGMCHAVISLNKKFEIVHLIRHFNCWHPSVHSCAGTWQNRHPTRLERKLLTVHDFAVIDTGSGSPDSLQCIWCGMFVESQNLAQHFSEVHPEDVEVPKCNLCMQELILNARFQEKFGIEFQITLPDEHHLKCNSCDAVFSSENSLDNHIKRRHIEGVSAYEDPEGDEEDIDLEEIGPEAFANSRMTLGKRRRPKRQFIMPALRQAIPLDSDYVEPIAECHWKCKLCEEDIYGAVISAAAIRHYKYEHPDQLDNMQYEICKSRLEKISDGCMEFIHPQLIECLLCQQTLKLHQPFNMCRAIRHLKAKHPNLMPEYAGLTQPDDFDDFDNNSTVLVRRAGEHGALISSADPMEDEEELIVAANNPYALNTTPSIVYEPTAFGLTPSMFEMKQGSFIATGNSPLLRTPFMQAQQTPVPHALRSAAKIARLDHNSVARSLPSTSTMLDPTVNSGHMGTLDRRLFESAQILQPRQLFLLLRPTVGVGAGGLMQQTLFDSPLPTVTMHQHTNDDDPILEDQRLNEIMAQARVTLRDDQQPQTLMSEESLLM